MADSEIVGVLMVAAGGYALARPMSIRNFPTASEWESDPERAKQEQRAYAGMSASFLVLGGLGLIVVGLIGKAP